MPECTPPQGRPKGSEPSSRETSLSHARVGTQHLLLRTAGGPDGTWTVRQGDANSEQLKCYVTLYVAITCPAFLCPVNCSCVNAQTFAKFSIQQTSSRRSAVMGVSECGQASENRQCRHSTCKRFDMNSDASPATSNLAFWYMVKQVCGISHLLPQNLKSTRGIIPEQFGCKK